MNENKRLSDWEKQELASKLTNTHVKSNQTMLINNLIGSDTYGFYVENDDQVMEWWLVSDWLIDKLADKGKPYLDNEFGSWWGRTCTGQGIYMDNVIQEIAIEGDR